MLQIMPYSGAVNYRRLSHGTHVFHDALEGVLKGEGKFHVINPDGEDHPFYPPYYKYDEEDTSKMSFDLFSGMKKVWFKEANEYTITVARVLLRETDLDITFADRRIKMFIPESERLLVSDQEPDAGDPTLLRGSDYFTSNLTGIRKAVGAEVSIPIIRQ